MARKPDYLAHKTQVLGHTWIVKYCNERHFKKEHGTDSLAITVLDDKEIWLRVKKLKPEVVTHELVHAWMEELCTNAADLSPAQVEEVAADMFAKYGARILKQTDQIINAYYVLKERVG